mmetsp:Transcript_65727/g.183006  ORF Transcript_65727/g.183006 Transcript_65727/m.183006 type:complete len:207 (+) Transcript_65727:248-868(+)
MLLSASTVRWLSPKDPSDTLTRPLSSNADSRLGRCIATIRAFSVSRARPWALASNVAHSSAVTCSPSARSAASSSGVSSKASGDPPGCSSAGSSASDKREITSGSGSLLRMPGSARIASAKLRRFSWSSASNSASLELRISRKSVRHSSRRPALASCACKASRLRCISASSSRIAHSLDTSPATSALGSVSSSRPIAGAAGERRST